MDSLLKHQDKYRTLLASKQSVYTILTALALVSAYSLTHLGGRKDGIPTVPSKGFFQDLTAEYREDPKGFVEKWAKVYGPVYRARLFGETLTVVTGQYVREVFLNDDFDFLQGIARRFDPRTLCDIASEEEMPSAELATLIKKSLTPRLDQFTERVNKQLVLAAHDMIGNLKPGEHKDIPHVYMLTQHMVAKASASVFVGETLADDPYLIDSFKNMVIEVAKTRNTPRPWLEPFEKGQAFYQWWIGKTSPVVKRHRAQLHNAVAPTVHERVARAKAEGDAYQRPDDLLQDVIDMYPTRKRRIDLMRFVVDMLTLLIFAALHTTSENSTLVIYRLLQHPEVMDALVEEQEAVLQEEGLPKDAPSTMLTRKMIKKLDKLDSACRESFRLKNDYLALPHLYTGKKPLTLSNGAVIKPGERAIINSWMNHTSSGTPASATHGYDSWDPYRFFGKDKQATKISEDYLFFGLGKHACPGRFFAIQEVKVLISALLREYKLSAPSGVVFPTNDTIRLPQGVLRIEKR